MDRDEPSQPVAYPTTKRMCLSTTPTTSRGVSAEHALLQNGFLVARLSPESSVVEYGKEQVYKSSLGQGREGHRGFIHHPFAAWCRSMRSKADRASWAVYSWSGSRQ